MKLLIPVVLKMAYNPLKPIETCNENPQRDERDQNAFDKVIDPLTEFHVPITSHNKTPNDAYNLPKVVRRKASSTSLYSKLDYYVDHNELPRVHRTLSNQSLPQSARNILTSNSLDFGSVNNIHILPNNDSVSEPNNAVFHFISNENDTSFNCNNNVSNGNIQTSPNKSDFDRKSESSDCKTPVPEFSANNNSLISPNEKFETASNVSVSSNVTDLPCSLLSSISDYDETTGTSKHLTYENIIKELQTKLEEAQAQNETYKFALKDLEWKTELNWQGKYQELLRQKSHYEGQLKTLQLQYDNVIKERLSNSTKSDARNALFQEYTHLQAKLNNIEKINSEISSKLILSTNEAKQFHTQNSKLESENEKLRVILQEMKIDLDSKNSVLQGLKNKITEQHIELQNQIQAKLKLNNFVASLNNEIDSIKKSEKWYIDQLHSCQYAKSKIQQELMSTQSNLIVNVQKMETLKIEITHWKNMCEETRLKAIREKENILKKMEIIEADMVEREAIAKCTSEKTDHIPIRSEDTYNAVENKLIIEEYQEKLNNLDKVLQEKEHLLNVQNKQNAEYLVRVTTLQKLLNEKELFSETLINTNNDLEMKCNNYNENIREKENQLLDLRNKMVNLEVSLHAANREKGEIDDMVKTIREDFNKFMKCYNNMKDALEEKSKIINTFECEKQELFMENNWRVCEIEELQQKVLSSKETQAEYMELKNMYNELIAEKEEIVNENTSLKLKIEEFGKDDNDTSIGMHKLKESLKLREDQLFNQTQNCELLNSEIAEKEKQSTSLKQQIKQLELTLKNESFKVSELKEINIALELKIQELSKKIQDSNSVIEQFNTLCRNSELEKHDLASQLEFIKKEQLLKPENTLNDLSVQTESTVHLDIIKTKLTQLFSDINLNNRIVCDDLNWDNILNKFDEYLTTMLEYKNSQTRKLELNQKIIKTLKNKLFILKNQIYERVATIEERCYFAMKNYEDIDKNVIFICKWIDDKKKRNSVEIQTDSEDSGKVEETGKQIVQVDPEQIEKFKKYERAKRTLLRKLKEELRARKTAEKNFQTLQETYNLAITEINNLKILHNRTEIEFETLKTRCSEYKDICDKQNDTILSLEKEKGEHIVKENNECAQCVEMQKIKDDLFETECKFKTLKDKLFWYEKELNDKDQGITECKKQLFNEKLQTSALKKQVSSIQMCLDNANSLLDTKQVEFTQLKQVCEKLEASKVDLAEQLESEQVKYQESKKKLDESLRLLEEQTAKDELLADEIKTISCHLHQKNLELANTENKLTILEKEHSQKINTLQNTITDLQSNISEVQSELEAVRNDKFFLQRLCADLKMSLQGTINQNKVLQIRLENLQNESTKISLDSSLISDIDDEYINRLLQESTVLPESPLINLRSCLDSLKTEMANLQQEILAKTQNNVSF